jgi:hypothetical protein
VPSLRRAAVVLAATAAVLTTATTASAATLDRFGYAIPNLAYQSSTVQSANLRAADMMLTAGSVVRTDVTWDPAQRSAPNFTTFDSLARNLSARGLQLLPQIHTGSGGTYKIPAITAWRSGLTQIAARYGPKGSFTTAGWRPVTAYELWNEPNTVTGNAGGRMTPAVAASLIRNGADALHSYASAHGWRAKVVGFAIGTQSIDYLNRLYAADPGFLSRIDAVSFHVYMSQDPSLPGGAAYPRRIRTLQTVRTWLNTHGGSHVEIMVTEGGYSGANGSRPLNVVDELQQASWSKAAIDWIRANPGLNVTLVTPFNPVDRGTVRYNGSAYHYDYWYENLGAVRADGTAKPFGSLYRQLVSSYSP